MVFDQADRSRRGRRFRDRAGVVSPWTIQGGHNVCPPDVCLQAALSGAITVGFLLWMAIKQRQVLDKRGHSPQTTVGSVPAVVFPNTANTTDDPT